MIRSLQVVLSALAVLLVGLLAPAMAWLVQTHPGLAAVLVLGVALACAPWRRVEMERPRTRAGSAVITSSPSCSSRSTTPRWARLPGCPSRSRSCCDLDPS